MAPSNTIEYKNYDQMQLSPMNTTDNTTAITTITSTITSNQNYLYNLLQKLGRNMKEFLLVLWLAAAVIATAGLIVHPVELQVVPETAHPAFFVIADTDGL